MPYRSAFLFFLQLFKFVRLVVFLDRHLQNHYFDYFCTPQTGQGL